MGAAVIPLHPALAFPPTPPPTRAGHPETDIDREPPHPFHPHCQVRVSVRNPQLQLSERTTHIVLSSCHTLLCVIVNWHWDGTWNRKYFHMLQLGPHDCLI